MMPFRDSLLDSETWAEAEDASWESPPEMAPQETSWRYEEWVKPAVRADIQFFGSGTSLDYAMGRSLPTRSDMDVRQKFRMYMNDWIQDTSYVSDTNRIVMNGSYQRIIGLGQQVLPLILEELSARSGHWFWALTAIVGEDVAVGSDRTEEARQRWLNWGRTHGHLR